MMFLRSLKPNPKSILYQKHLQTVSLVRALYEEESEFSMDLLKNHDWFYMYQVRTMILLGIFFL